MTTTQEKLLEMFTYDPNEPLALRWRVSVKKSNAAIGAIAGYWHAIRAGSPILRRYVELRIDGKRKRIPTSRAVWIYHHGQLPQRSIEFRNGDPSDCRIDNLEEAGERKLPREYVLWNWYRLTPADYERMLANQGGVCAICLNPETSRRPVRYRVSDSTDRLAIDHCHTNGHIRGLLCTACNNGLGRFRDDPTVLRRAAAYLEVNQASAKSPQPIRKIRQKRPATTEMSGIIQRGDRWRARITINYVPISLGTFATAEEARAARDAAVKERHGVDPSIAG